MKAMTILIRCRAYEVDVRRIRQKIRQRRDAAQSISPVISDDGKPQGGGDPDRIATLMCAVTELEAALEARERARRVEVAATCVYLDTLGENESAVLYSYYVNRLKVGAIAAKLRFTDGYIRRLKSDAEKKLSALDDAAVRDALPPWYQQEHGEGCA